MKNLECSREGPFGVGGAGCCESRRRNTARKRYSAGQARSPPALLSERGYSLKTYKNLYPQVYNFENLYLAYRKARTHSLCLTGTRRRRSEAGQAANALPQTLSFGTSAGLPSVEGKRGKGPPARRFFAQLYAQRGPAVPRFAAVPARRIGIPYRYGAMSRGSPLWGASGTVRATPADCDPP